MESSDIHKQLGEERERNKRLREENRRISEKYGRLLELVVKIWVIYPEIEEFFDEEERKGGDNKGNS